MSTLVRLQGGDPPSPTLALVAAVALHEIVAVSVPEVQIKWPNDLLVGGAKLAGILLERVEDAVVVGFGVNLAQHPTHLVRAATDIATLTGNTEDPAIFLERLAERFSRWLGRWRGEGLRPVQSRWLAAAHPVGTALSAGGMEGLFDGVDETGSLRLRLADGSTHVIHAGDVFLI